MYTNTFKNQYSFQDRFNESYKVLTSYPDRVPIICEPIYFATRECPFIDKRKYLVPNNLTVGQFLYVIRKRLKFSPEKALFLFIENNIPASSQLIGELYHLFKNADGFLYISYSLENTFG